MEELKHEQEMRERRNQERENWQDGRPTSTVRYDFIRKFIISQRVAPNYISSQILQCIHFQPCLAFI